MVRLRMNAVYSVNYYRGLPTAKSPDLVNFTWEQNVPKSNCAGHPSECLRLAGVSFYGCQLLQVPLFIVRTEYAQELLCRTFAGMVRYFGVAGVIFYGCLDGDVDGYDC